MLKFKFGDETEINKFLLSTSSTITMHGACENYTEKYKQTRSSVTFKVRFRTRLLYTLREGLGGGGGGGHLGQFLLGMCRWPLRAPTPLQSILWPIIDPI